MAKNYLGFDVGGTTIKYSVIDEDLNFLYHDTVPTNNNANNHILKVLKDVTAQVQSETKIDGIGISTAGIVSPEGSIQYAGPTIPNYANTPIKVTIADQSKVPVNVLNDVDAALLGEVYVQKLNAAGIYCIALGTGIGGAYLQNGKLTSGTHGKANSIGYTLFDGLTQTNYEQRCSTLALERKLKKYSTGVIKAFEKAKAGEELFVDIITAWAFEVAAGIAEIIILFDPEYIIIGGAVSSQGDYLLSLLNQQLNVILPKDFNETKLQIATQGNKAQLIGAISAFLKKENWG